MTVSSIRAARGTELSCRGWQQEAALRMLQNNLDPEVAEHPQELVVYGGTGKAARDWASYEAIVRTLKTLADDETLLVQSGKPVGVLQTHEWAPRVLLANSNLVGDWATWDEFRRLEALGLTMYGQMTAGSWIYIGSQGILQGTYETFAAVGEKRFGGSLAGTITLTGGLGGMGGAQPLAVTMAGGVCICVEVDQSRIERRLASAYLDVEADDLDHALRAGGRGPRRAQALEHRPARQLRRRLPGAALARRADRRRDRPDLRPRPARLPAVRRRVRGLGARRASGRTSSTRARESMARHVEAMVGFQDKGAEVFDYGNSLRAEAKLGGYERAFDYPGFVPAYIRPLFCEGRGPFRWAALSGDPADIAATDKAVLGLFPENESLARWMKLAAEKVQFQGLPARICWLGQGERHLAGLAFNDLVASGAVAAPIVIGRDHLDTGSVASPYRETEAMLDGSDAIADWPLLNAMVNVASGASWVSIHHGGGVGIGRSIHAGQVSVADGTELAAQKLGASFEQRSRHRRDPPRRRGVRARRGGRGRARRARADGGMTQFHADYAWLGGDRATADVLITVDHGRIVSAVPGVARPRDAVHLRGVTLPGLANAHSHAFQRALRGRTQRGGGSFWTWREDMYALAGRITPDDSFALARGTYAEMLRAGITCVGEFDYVHHSEALIAAAREVGIRLTLLDACYLAGGFGEPPAGAQARFSDGDAERWAERVSAIRGARVGAAIHSVRAVPADQLHTVVEWAEGKPLHFHVSEQRAENEACLAAHGVTPVQLLAEHGALGPTSTAVHATHLTASDGELLRDTTICMCPTTERDLADGIGRAGPKLSLGSDSHAVIDLFEEARAVELNLRLATERRGHFTAHALLTGATNHASLGWPEARPARGGRARGLHHCRARLTPPRDRRARDAAGVDRLRRHRG